MQDEDGFEGVEKEPDIIEEELELDDWDTKDDDEIVPEAVDELSPYGDQEEKNMPFSSVLRGRRVVCSRVFKAYSLWVQIAAIVVRRIVLCKRRWYPRIACTHLLNLFFPLVRSR